MMHNITSILCAIITFGMALLQLSLTLGAPFGEYALGGQHRVLPKKMRSISSAYTLIFTFIGLSYLQIGNVISIGLNPNVLNVIIILNTLFLAYAIIGNGFLTKSKKEKYVMTPISIIQFILSVITFFLVHNQGWKIL